MAVALGAAAALILTTGCSGSSTSAAAGRTPGPGSVVPTPTGPVTPTSPSVTASPDGAGPHTTGTGARRSSTQRTVAAPTPGNINVTVPSRVVITKPAVPLRSSADFGRRVRVSAVRIRAINAKAHGPGEISGPAVDIELRFTNGGPRAVDVDNAVVNVTDDTGDPASNIAGPPADPVRGRLAAHHSVVGHYVFTIARSKRMPITISVSYAPSAPVVHIVGDVA